MVAKSEITGALGTPAPPGAPQEVTLPGSERATPEQIATARANEVELPPFNPGGEKQMTIEQQAIFLGKTVEEIVKLRAEAGMPVVERMPVAGTAVGNPAPSPPANPPAGVILDARGKPVISSVRPVPPRPQRSSLRQVHKPPTVVLGEPLEQQLPPQGLPEDVDTLETTVGISDVPPYGGQPRDRSSELHGFTEALVEGTPDSLPAPEAAVSAIVTRDGVPVASVEIVGPEAEAALAAARATGVEPSPLPIIRPDPAKHQPAASDTDSPARGTPPPMATLPEGKRITGGFGDPVEAEYYPLDGTELRELVYALMDSIHARLQDDLRFSFATTYPRCSARVVVEIDAFAQDQTLTVEKVMVPPHEKTPMEVARIYGDQVVFCVTAERAEMTEDGRSIAPPNQTRKELQLPIPRKTAVQTPAGRMIVDLRR